MPGLSIVHAEGHHVDLGPHVFPIRKYEPRPRAVARPRGRGPGEFVPAPPATWEQLALVHTAEWIDRLRGGHAVACRGRAAGAACDAGTVEGFRHMCGWTDRGSAARDRRWRRRDAGRRVSPRLRRARRGLLHVQRRRRRHSRCCSETAGSPRAAVVDLDVHHGNGTAAIFAGDPAVFTLSMHQWNNYPAQKPPSSLDVHLPDGTGDAEYLSELQRRAAQRRGRSHPTSPSTSRERIPTPTISSAGCR